MNHLSKLQSEAVKQKPKELKVNGHIELDYGDGMVIEDPAYDSRKPKELDVVNKCNCNVINEPKKYKNRCNKSIDDVMKPKELDWSDIVKNILFANGVKCDSEQFLIEDILALLTQQRTELLEEIKKLEYGGYIQVMASKKNWDERNGYDMAKEDITNLLNKKDE